MKNAKNLILLGIIAVGIVGLAFYVYLSRKDNDSVSTTAPNVVQSLTPIPSPRLDSTSSTSSGQASSPQATPSSTEEPFSGLHGIKLPATCQVGGEINFPDKNTFSTRDSKISWQNVDSQGRLINWRISPRDNLKIGPNIFANLAVPDGQYENLTVRLPENPVAKNYLLTASVTYGQFIQGDLKVKEVTCSGQVKVNLNF